MGPNKVLLVDWLGEHIHITAPASVSVQSGDIIQPNPDPDGIIVWKQ
jgi:hypothetical protein